MGTITLQQEKSPGKDIECELIGSGAVIIDPIEFQNCKSYALSFEENCSKYLSSC